MEQDAIYHLAGIQMMNVVKSESPAEEHGLVTVYQRDDNPELTLVNIETSFGMVHLIMDMDRHWLVNSRIDLMTFNEIYRITKEGGCSCMF